MPLNSRVVQTRGTLRIQANNTNSNDAGGSNNKNSSNGSTIMPILIMTKKEGEQEENIPAGEKAWTVVL